MLSASTIAADALHIQAEGCGYIWGTFGEIWTERRQLALEDEYNANPAANAEKYPSVANGRKWIGMHVYDCSGLVMRICANHGLKLPHGSNSQYRDSCGKKGKLTKGERDDGGAMKPGTLVFLYRKSDDCRHHVGIYVGFGQVVEAKGGKYGVVISKVTAWHEWGELKRVDYSADPAQTDPGGEGEKMDTVRKGDRGAAVTALQQALVKLGYGIETDGIFGGETQAAVKAFQKKNGLDADGVCGPLTWAALTAAAGGISDGAAAADPLKKGDGQTADGSGTAAPKPGSVTISLDSETARQLALALKASGVIV